MKKIHLNYSQINPALSIMLVTAPKAVLHVCILAMAQMIAERDIGDAPTNINSVLAGLLIGARDGLTEAEAQLATEASIEKNLGITGIPSDLKAELDKIFKG